jgi:hypothetical protein
VKGRELRVPSHRTAAAPLRTLDSRHDERCSRCRGGAGRPTRRWHERPAPKLVLPPGAYSKAPAWSTRRHWLNAVLPTAISRGRGVLRKHHIAPVTFARIMALHAQHADDATGRDCRSAVNHILDMAKCSERTVQRARAAARELGIGIEVFRGRHLTLDERMACYDVGDGKRGWTSVYALGCPRSLARHVWLPYPRAYPQVNGNVVDHAVDDGTPPVGRSTRRFKQLNTSLSSAKSAEQGAPRRPRTNHPSPRSPRCRRARWNPAALALAMGLQQRVRALRDVHPGRLAPSLSRFALVDPLPWTVEEVHDAIERVLARQGWTWIRRPQHPAAYLARILREIDHVSQLSTPKAAEDPVRATSSLPIQARRYPNLHDAFEAATRPGINLCDHGVGGADGLGRSARCAYCRRKQAM